MLISIEAAITRCKNCPYNRLNLCVYNAMTTNSQAKPITKYKVCPKTAKQPKKFHKMLKLKSDMCGNMKYYYVDGHLAIKTIIFGLPEINCVNMAVNYMYKRGKDLCSLKKTIRHKPITILWRAELR